MTDQQQPFPNAFEMFKDVLDAGAASRISGIVATVQARHFQALIAEGINEETAGQLTARTTEKLIETSVDILKAVATIVQAVGQNAQPIGDAVIGIAEYVNEQDRQRR